LDKYGKYIKPGEIKQLEQSARYYDRVNKAEDRAAREDADRTARANFHSDFNKLELSLVNEDGDLVATKDHLKEFRDIVNRNARGASLEPGRVSSMLSGLERMIQTTNRIKAAQDEPETVRILTDRLFDPDNPTTMLDIGIARNDGKLSANSARNLGAI